MYNHTMVHWTAGLLGFISVRVLPEEYLLKFQLPVLKRLNHLTFNLPLLQLDELDNSNLL